MICGTFSERDLQLKASCASLPPCIRCMTYKIILRSTTLEVGCSGSEHNFIISSASEDVISIRLSLDHQESKNSIFRRIIFHSHAQTQAHTHTHRDTHTHKHMHLHTHTHAHTHTHTHTYTHMHTRTYTRTHTGQTISPVHSESLALAYASISLALSRACNLAFSLLHAHVCLFFMCLFCMSPQISLAFRKFRSCSSSPSPPFKSGAPSRACNSNLAFSLLLEHPSLFFNRVKLVITHHAQ